VTLEGARRRGASTLATSIVRTLTDVLRNTIDLTINGLLLRQ
jgi:hypothetical protein